MPKVGSNEGAAPVTEPNAGAGQVKIRWDDTNMRSVYANVGISIYL